MIWNGRGFVVAVIAFVCLLSSEFLSEWYFRDDAYYQHHGWPKLVAFLLAGIIVWLLSHHWNKTPTRTLIEKDTGKEVVLHKDDSLFFIPLRYWGPLLFALGIAFFFVKE
jgi:hypothetical protein